MNLNIFPQGESTDRSVTKRLCVFVCFWILMGHSESRLSDFQICFCDFCPNFVLTHTATQTNNWLNLQECAYEQDFLLRSDQKAIWLDVVIEVRQTQGAETQFRNCTFEYWSAKHWKCLRILSFDWWSYFGVKAWIASKSNNDVGKRVNSHNDNGTVSWSERWLLHLRWHNNCNSGFLFHCNTGPSNE